MGIYYKVFSEEEITCLRNAPDRIKRILRSGQKS